MTSVPGIPPLANWAKDHQAKQSAKQIAQKMKTIWNDLRDTGLLGSVAVFAMLGVDRNRL